MPGRHPLQARCHVGQGPMTTETLAPVRLGEALALAAALVVLMAIALGFGLAVATPAGTRIVDAGAAG